MLLAIFLSFIGAIFLFSVFVITVDFFVAGKGYSGKVTDHFDGKHFWNIGWTKHESYRVESPKGNYGKIRAFFKWIIHRKKPKWEQRSIEKTVPKERNMTEEFHVTFIGHATLLIQVGGLNIVTDPVWSYRTSPFKHIGPHRFTEMGVDFDILPPIDVVLLSHNHYDHMDITTLEKLQARDNPKIYTGLGNSEYLRKYDIFNAHDMEWWDEEILEKSGIQDLKIIFVPAQHFSARGLKDRNKTLWGGFVIEIHGKTLYFAGDTGYGHFIQEIGKKFPHGIDIGLLPIGAYKPRWFMADVHTSPEEALKMQLELKIKTGIGIHWGSFPLADDGQDDPLIDLAIATEKKEYTNLDFRVGPNGTVWKI